MLQTGILGGAGSYYYTAEQYCRWITHFYIIFSLLSSFAFSMRPLLLVAIKAYQGQLTESDWVLPYKLE